ncbi:PqiC family protein [Elstera litoralis]|uniref:PqiC family protein n=1 Tax=Elstera litoralis TaxID=552518 RepID=UPI0006987D05|nr:PqiC family protein [Elstera litoralis]
MSRLPFFLSLGLLAPALTGCLTGTPPARLYVLDPLEVVSPAPRLDQRLALGIGATQVPEYLDRPELVVRAGTNEVSAVETDRWAERLPVTLSRVLTENLSRLLGVEAQLMQSGRAVGSLDYEIYLDITRFEIAPDAVRRWAGAGLSSMPPAAPKSPPPASRARKRAAAPAFPPPSRA